MQNQEITANIIFKNLVTPNVISWNAMIAGYVQKGLEETGLNLYYKLRQNGLTPDQFTFASVFSHGGLVKEGWDYFRSMKTDYGMHPGEKHYAAMVDILGRAGRLGKNIMQQRLTC